MTAWQAELSQRYPSLVADSDLFRRWRRDLHAHPELGFEEARTAQFVADKLQSFGVEITRGYGKTGVVGRLTRGDSDKVVALRADMDALPMTEQNTFEHRSTVPGKFHGCGHDGHTVMLLAAARYLAAHGRFSGTAVFIFQPAEEGLGGASAMMRDGLFDDYAVDALYAMHNAPGYPLGSFATCAGALLGALECFDITITGVGGHSAMPEHCVDPIVIAAAMVTALQSIVSRNLSPLAAGVISVTTIHAGDAYNVIPETCMLTGSIRYLCPDVGELIRGKIAAIVSNVAASFGATATVTFKPNGYPPLINDVGCVTAAAKAAERLVGADNVQTDVAPLLGSDDFAHFLTEKPGCYVMIGNGLDSHGGCMVHHPEYDFNDDIIALGASFWTELIEGELLPS